MLPFNKDVIFLALLALRVDIRFVKSPQDIQEHLATSLTRKPWPWKLCFTVDRDL
jgi:hypothetical protein